MDTACITPPGPEDERLLAYLEGESDDETQAHIQACAGCSQRAQDLARLQVDMTARLYRYDCPPASDLGEFHLNLLSGEQSAAIQQHLHSCPHCRREVAALQTFLAELAPEIEVGALDRVRVWLADLISGPGLSAPAPLALGLRGEAEQESWVYQAGEVEVVIEVQDDPEHPGRKALLGLVTGLKAGTGPAQVALIQAGDVLEQVHVDRLGNFAFEELVPGNYDLDLNDRDLEVKISDLSM
jgi:hypothetical protein